MKIACSMTTTRYAVESVHFESKLERELLDFVLPLIFIP